MDLNQCLILGSLATNPTLLVEGKGPTRQVSLLPRAPRLIQSEWVRRLKRLRSSTGAGKSKPMITAWPMTICQHNKISSAIFFVARSLKSTDRENLTMTRGHRE